MRSLLLAFALALTGTALGQVVVLDAFNAGATTGSVRPGTSWVNNVTPGATTLTVGGTARDDNGWGATGQAINATGMNFLAITAQRDAGHAAAAFVIQFEDRNLNTQVFTLGASAFATGGLTTVLIPLTGWAANFDRTQIAGWSIGGGTVGTAAFRMTLDHLALTATASPDSAVAPGVTGDYAARSRAPGESITFTVTASGSTPFTYQWFKNGTAVTDNATAATASLTLAAVNATDAGSYTCVVTNSAGSITSGAFILTVSATPATVALGALAQTYTGALIAITTATAPAGLPVIVTYNAGTVPPTGAGSYAVIATVNHPNYTGRAEGTLVIARAPQSISYAALPAALTVGTAFNLAATASSGGPVSFAVVRGNAQLAGNALTPLDTAVITIRATHPGDSNYLPATSDFSFSAAKQNQSITFPAPVAAAAGAPISLSATATSALPVTFSVITGPATLGNRTLTPTGSGLVIVRAAQAGNDTFNAAPDVDRAIVLAAPAAPATAPTIARAPVSQAVAPGAPLSLAVTAVGTDPLTYQWFKDDVALAGATTAVFTIASATAATAGSYTVGVTNVAGNIRSAAAVVTVDAAAAPETRLSNFSTRARAGTGDQVVIAGFVISGTTPKPVLVRAIGPTLATFGVTGTLAAPTLELFAEQRSLATNTGWSTNANPAAVATAAQQVGAFALTATSADSALLATLPPGNYTAVIGSADQRPGVGLIEVYDLSAPVRGQKISNLSIRASAGVDADTLIVGVVVQGTAPKRMLIRAAGPALAGFGVSGVLARPQLAVFSGSTELVRNAGWSTGADGPALAPAAASVGAFAFAAGSLDSALIVTLAPGNYTAQVSGTGGTTGVALVEAYELP